MTEKRVLPNFADEAEEATWWFEHADELAGDFIAAAADGSLGRGRAARRAGLVPKLILLEPKDAALADEQATRHGVDYEKYVRGLLHEALMRDTRA
jgi:hypothetical protein